MVHAQHYLGEEKIGEECLFSECESLEDMMDFVKAQCKEQDEKLIVDFVYREPLVDGLESYELD
jgi:hypothetical protein